MRTIICSLGAVCIVAAAAAVGNLEFTTAEFDDSLTYRSNGRVLNATVNATSGEFSVCDNRGAGHARVIIVEVSGRPRLSKTTAAGMAPVCP